MFKNCKKYIFKNCKKYILKKDVKDFQTSWFGRQDLEFKVFIDSKKIFNYGS